MNEGKYDIKEIFSGLERREIAFETSTNYECSYDLVRSLECRGGASVEDDDAGGCEDKNGQVRCEDPCGVVAR